jgi:hypothetical protein
LRLRRRLPGPRLVIRSLVMCAVVMAMAVGGMTSGTAFAASAPRQPGAGAHAKAGTGAPGTFDAADALQLLSQSAWVGPGQGQFALRLQVTASDPADEMLDVFVYSELTTRTEFQQALRGVVSNFFYEYKNGPVPLDELHRDPAGGVDVDIPVNGGTDSLPLGTTSGVYPVEAFLQEGGVRRSPLLTTFLVYAGNDASTLKRLNVDLVVPMSAKVPIGSSGALGAVPAGTGAELLADSKALASWHVPVSVAADVPTVEALGQGGPAERMTVAYLRTAVSFDDELLPATSLPLDIPALVSSGLTSDVSAEVSAGDRVLGSLLGPVPSLATWAFGQGIDPAGIAALVGMGALRVAVPDSDLSAVPASYQKLTFAFPTKLAVAGGGVDAVAADAELSSRVVQADAPGQGVLVGCQVLAELAMIDLGAPGEVRGVVLLPPPGMVLNASFLRVFLSGLQGNPLLNAVTLADMFKQVPLAEGPEGLPLTRQLEASRSVAPLGGTGDLRGAREVVAADGEVYGHASGLVDKLDVQLAVSLSSVFSSWQRSGEIAATLRSAEAALEKVHLPPPTSITLTSRQGRLPLTLLSSAGVPAHVRLVLTSEQLSFMGGNPGGGSCRSVNLGSEYCELTLDHATTTLQVPVAVRTSGAFQLSLKVETPDGREAMAIGTDTVRSTAISGVGLVLMVGAALFLGVWWVRNARHGHRAKRLVPRPVDVNSGGLVQSGVTLAQSGVTLARDAPAPVASRPLPPERSRPEVPPGAESAGDRTVRLPRTTGLPRRPPG